MKNCPNCQNEGFAVVQGFYTGELEQEQCQFCYEEPDSIFNTLKAQAQEIERLTKLIGIDTDYMELKDNENKRLLARIAEIERAASGGCATSKFQCAVCGEHVLLFKYDFDNAKCVHCVKKGQSACKQ